MGAVLHGLLAVLAPLEAIVHDVHIGARLDGVSGLSGSLGVFLLPWPVDVPVQKLNPTHIESRPFDKFLTSLRSRVAFRDVSLL